MSENPHFTQRRGFIAALGFGALGLYGTWAAYGAAPLPFASLFTAPSGHDADAAMSAHRMHDAPAAAPMVHGHETSALTPDAFVERQAEFLKRFRRGDGSVHPGPSEPSDDHQAMPQMPGMPGPMAQHDHGTMPDHPAMAAPGSTHDHMAMMPAGIDHAAMPHMSMPENPAMSTMHQPTAAASEAIDVYLSAGRFAFDPDALVLQKGQRYRFLMLASDVTHGAAIALGHASRIVRLRPGIVTQLELTFREAGDHLVYCTVHCGAGHDQMRAKITVA